jgi:hypothetical protein
MPDRAWLNAHVRAGVARVLGRRVARVVGELRSWH